MAIAEAAGTPVAAPKTDTKLQKFKYCFAEFLEKESSYLGYLKLLLHFQEDLNEEGALSKFENKQLFGEIRAIATITEEISAVVDAEFRKFAAGDGDSFTLAPVCAALAKVSMEEHSGGSVYKRDVNGHAMAQGSTARLWPRASTTRRGFYPSEQSPECHRQS